MVDPIFVYDAWYFKSILIKLRIKCHIRPIWWVEKLPFFSIFWQSYLYQGKDSSVLLTNYKKQHVWDVWLWVDFITAGVKVSGPIVTLSLIQTLSDALCHFCLKTQWQKEKLPRMAFKDHLLKNHLREKCNIWKFGFIIFIKTRKQYNNTRTSLRLLVLGEAIKLLLNKPGSKTIKVLSVFRMCAEVSDWSKENSFSKWTNQKPYLELGDQL